MARPWTADKNVVGGPENNLFCSLSRSTQQSRHLTFPIGQEEGVEEWEDLSTNPLTD